MRLHFTLHKTPEMHPVDEAEEVPVLGALPVSGGRYQNPSLSLPGLAGAGDVRGASGYRISI
jgi:hypothetical protein